MVRRLLLLLLVAGAPGCFKFPPTSIGYCPSGAVGLYVDLFGEDKNTDEIALQISIEGAQSLRKSFKRQPGGTYETLEIDLANYDADRYKHMTVIGVARLNGKAVASGHQVQQIDNNCTSVDLLLSGASTCLDDSDCAAGVTCTNNCCGGSYC
jgi:hypothetical protein